MKYKFVYEIERINIKLEGEVIAVMPDLFFGLSIIDDYLGKLSPKMELSVAIQDKQFEKVKKCKELKVELSIMETAINEKGVTVSKRLWINKLFDAQLNIIDPVQYTSEKITPDNRQETTVPAIFLLYDKKFMNGVRINKDYIFKDASPGSMMTAFLIDRGITKGVIATPPAISSAVKTAQIPIGNLVGNIDYLTINYGLYSAKAIVYKDFFNLYIIDKNYLPIDLPGEKNTVNFNVIDPTIGGAPTYPVADPKGNTYNIDFYKNNLDSNRISPEFEDMLKTPNVIQVDSKGNVRSNQKNTNVANVRVIRNRHQMTPYLATEKGITGDSYMLEFTDVCIDYFKPYRKYVFSELIKGEYFLLGRVITLDGTKKQTGSNLTCTVGIRVQKIR